MSGEIVQHIEEMKTLKLVLPKNADMGMLVDEIIFGRCYEAINSGIDKFRIKKCELKLGSFYTQKSPSDGPVIFYHWNIYNGSTARDEPPKTWSDVISYGQGDSRISSDVQTSTYNFPDFTVFRNVTGSGTNYFVQVDEVGKFENIEFNNVVDPNTVYQTFRLGLCIDRTEYTAKRNCRVMDFAEPEMKTKYMKMFNISEKADPVVKKQTQRQVVLKSGHPASDNVENADDESVLPVGDDICIYIPVITSWDIVYTPKKR